MEAARAKLLASAAYLKSEETRLHASVLAAAAGTAVSFGALPPKLNPFIQPLMLSVRRESDVSLQRRSASSLAALVKVCATRTPPRQQNHREHIGDGVRGSQRDPSRGSGTRTPSPPRGLRRRASPPPATTPRSRAAVARRGAEETLRALSAAFGDALFDAAPKTWEAMSAPLDPTVAAAGTLPPQAVVDGLQIFKTLGPSAAATSRHAEKTLALIPSAFHAATRDAAATRVTASNALAALARAHPERVVPELLALVVPALEDAGEADAAAAKRRGAAAVAAALVESMGATLAAYCVLLLVPLAGRMSDPVQGTRETATRSFAALVPLLPLARGAAPPPGLSDSQRERSARDGAFLEALLDNSKVQDFELPFACKRTLRPYQQEGVNWLAFLRRFKLHGALCDDMGLGKTLQSTCILAATVVERRAAGSPRLPALVVCPPTLVGHWAHEINQYVDEDVLRPLQYQGTPHERAAIRPLIASGKYDVVITSYDSLRSDADELLEGTSWCYCILDEGHAIRNPKARITRAWPSARSIGCARLAPRSRTTSSSCGASSTFSCRASSAPSASFDRRTESPARDPSPQKKAADSPNRAPSPREDSTSR